MSHSASDQPTQPIDTSGASARDLLKELHDLHENYAATRAELAAAKTKRWLWAVLAVCATVLLCTAIITGATLYYHGQNHGKYLIEKTEKYGYRP